MAQSIESAHQASNDVGNRSRRDKSPARLSNQNLNESCDKSSSCGVVNVGDEERLASMIAGAVIGTFGVGRGGLTGLVLMALGGGLMYRGATGHCNAYQALDISTAHNQGDHNRNSLAQQS